MKKHVGIIIVSYNAPQAVTMTLDSLASTPVNTRFSVALIDNASEPESSSIIANCMKKHLRKGNFKGHFFPLPDNKGFSGGNNIGIAYFLSQPDITHICLLNSDIVVSNNWLDYLLEDDFDAVGPLTNASNNEQGIPVPYSIDKDNNKLQINLEDYLNFATQRREIWNGHIQSSKFISFFCTILSRRLVQKVGYLDTRFYPGAYEDDDYCLRILENGFEMKIRRDVYVHHWGSASFRQLALNDRSSFGMKNRNRFIEKHQRPWQDRTHLPWHSWFQDVRYAFSKNNISNFSPTLNLYFKNIQDLSKALDNQYASLVQTLAEDGIPTTVSLLDETVKFQKLLSKLSKNLPLSSSKLKSLVQSEQLLDENVQNKISEISTIIAKLNKSKNIPISIETPDNVKSEASENLWNILLTFNKGVVFFSGYPYPDRLKDGYFQRVKAIDSLLSKEHYRIYCDVSQSYTGKDIIHKISKNTIELKVNPHNIAHQLLVSDCVQRCKNVYYHSVLRMEFPIQRNWLREQNIYKFFDVHGVVPEEFIYCSSDYVSSALYSDIEAQAIEQCDTIIVVSEEMGKHLNTKYVSDHSNKIITSPIIPNLPPAQNVKKYSPSSLPKIVYAGGAHPWQCIPKMLNAALRIIDKAEIDIFATIPQDIKNIASKELLKHPNFSLNTVSHDELCIIYPKYHYGFLLRENVIVNKAACPTKLLEYLAYGIVPILDFENIGDFKSLGMKFIHIKDLEEGKFLPIKKHKEFALHNLNLLNSLKITAETNMNKLKLLLNNSKY